MDRDERHTRTKEPAMCKLTTATLMLFAALSLVAAVLRANGL